MRFYTFCNYYLSSIQQGIQSAHCMHDMFVHYHMYPADSKARLMMWEWASKHKTMVVLNGGNSAELNNILQKVATISDNLFYPYASFSEDEQSLNFALTCVGIVVPEKIYAYNSEVLMLDKMDRVAWAYNRLGIERKYNISSIELELAELIDLRPLAR